MSATNLDAVTVVLCVDRNVLPGLHVTLYTALLHLDAGRLLDINLFAENLRAFPEITFLSSLVGGA